MRRLFNKVFNLSSQSEETIHALSLPPVLPFDEMKQRAIVGYLARHIAQRLDHENADLLFYLSFSKNIDESPLKVVDGDFPIKFAALLLSWIQEGKEIEQKVKELNFSNDIESCLVDTYHELKKEIVSESLLNTSPVNIKGTQEDEHTEKGEVTERKEWEIYRDVMYAVTQKKLLLISKDEITNYTTGRVLCEGEIKERADIPKCRQLAQQCLQQLGFNTVNVMSWLLMISEAITNILKHADEGRMTLVEVNGGVRVIVEDKGPGFSLKDLPNTTLMAGYSTKKSLGQGFTLMMKMTEQVLLYTSSKGSTIILILNKEEGSPS